MSLGTGNSQEPAYLSDPEDGSPEDSHLSHRTAQPGSGSEEGPPLMTGPPVDSTADPSSPAGGSVAARGLPPANTGRGRHGPPRAHRRRESPPPPPPPPEFGDGAAPGLRIPMLSAAGTETGPQAGATETVPAATPTSPQLRTPSASMSGGTPNKNDQHPNRTGVDGGPDCAICLQACVHPVQLPCLHVFCFLCAKGAIKNSRRCAMCRSEVPADYLDNPLLLNTEQLQLEMALSDGYQWYYEGRNGWWKYDERTAADLETAFTGGEKRAELLVAGYRYVVDFETMLQLRRSDPARRRRVKRDLASAAKKGVAGIRVGGGGPAEGEPALETALQGLTLAEGTGAEQQEGGDTSAL